MNIKVDLNKHVEGLLTPVRGMNEVFIGWWWRIISPSLLHSTTDCRWKLYSASGVQNGGGGFVTRVVVVLEGTHLFRA